MGGSFLISGPASRMRLWISFVEVSVVVVVVVVGSTEGAAAAAGDSDIDVDAGGESFCSDEVAILTVWDLDEKALF